MLVLPQWHALVCILWSVRCLWRCVFSGMYMRLGRRRRTAQRTSEQVCSLASFAPAFAQADLPQAEAGPCMNTKLSLESVRVSECRVWFQQSVSKTDRSLSQPPLSPSSHGPPALRHRDAQHLLRTEAPLTLPLFSVPCTRRRPTPYEHDPQTASPPQHPCIFPHTHPSPPPRSSHRTSHTMYVSWCRRQGGGLLLGGTLVTHAARHLLSPCSSTPRSFHLRRRHPFSRPASPSTSSSRGRGWSSSPPPAPRSPAFVAR